MQGVLSSNNFADFVLKLLAIDPTERLGFRGFDEISSHPWFEGFSWRQLHYKTIHSPFLNIIEKN